MKKQSVKSKIWIYQVWETSNWGIQNIWNGVKSCFLSGCTQCHKLQDSSVLSWAWWAASRFALMTALWVPGLHCDIPCLTGSTWSPPAAESWASIPPLTHYSQYRNSNSKVTSYMISQRHTWVATGAYVLPHHPALYTPSAECTNSAVLRAFVLTGITCYKERSIWPFSPEELAN